MTQATVDADARAEVTALTAAACLFHGFSDRSRLSIVRHLALGEHRVVDLTRHLGLAQSTVSKHLACLLDCGIVTVRPQGRASVYALAHPAATARPARRRRDAAGPHRRRRGALPAVRRGERPVTAPRTCSAPTGAPVLPAPDSQGTLSAERPAAARADAPSCSPGPRWPTTWSRPPSR